MKTKLRHALVTSLAGALLLGGCATIHRPEGGLAPSGSALHMVDPRIDAATLREGFVRRMDQAGEPLTVLSLSGGGANGAYGAGVIVGWSASAKRPEFSIVTGVSTGALAAPFAFLGPAWDDELEAAYAGGGAEGLLAWRHLAFLVSPSLFSARQLRELVDKNVTPQLLAAVAVEHAKGRRLYVATTNLDSQETVIWDMGLLASQGDVAALELFRKILIAAASIPGVFPPVFIVASGPDGRLVQQMHVDGAVNTPFLGMPEDMLLWTSPRPQAPGSAIYILVNGMLERQAEVTPGSLRAILVRTMSSSGIASARIHIAANAAFAKRNGMDVRVSSIPKGTPASLLNFSAPAMSTLFDEGRRQALAGTAWGPVNQETSDEDARATTPTP